MAKAGSIRGLQVFISDIRACQNREQETKRVDKELAKIRKKFGSEKSNLGAYDRKKYVWKLLYIYMLGYDVEFGHKQACDLIPAQRYSEKQVGYTACAILLNEKDEFLRLAINAIHMDMISRNESFQCLALGFVANIAGQEMAEALTPDVLKLLTSGTARPVVKKKAALCLLRLVRKTPLDQMLIASEGFSPVMGALLEERDMGVLLGAVTLLLGLLPRTGAAGYEQCQPRLLKILERCALVRDVTPDYTYYGIASPWLQVKCLRALQFFPAPDSPAAQKTLHDTLQAIMTSCTESAKSSNPNKSNAQHAILFEAISLCLALDTSRDLLTSSVANLGRFLSVKEPNIRYLALENLARLALVPEVLDAMRHHVVTITANLKDPDVSVRKRALDLLFTMCDSTNAADTVEELLKYLTVADFAMREELVLKVAILAEKFAPSVQWYVDVVLALLERAGDFCSDDIWHRVVQLVTNNEPMQQYAASQVVEALKRGAAHEPLVCSAAYVLGEYGRLIKSETSALEQFHLLHERFPASNSSTKGLLMSAYLKLMLLDQGDEQLKKEVTAVFTRYSRNADMELQQRAVEFLALARAPANATSHYILPMPKWEDRESSLLRRLQAGEGTDADAEAATAGAASGSGMLDEEVLPGAGLAGIGPAASGEGSVGSPTKAAAAPVASPVARAPIVDLLGDDDVTYGNGSAPHRGLAAVSTLSPAAPATSARTLPLDPLDELLGGASIAPTVPAPAHGDPFAPAASGGSPTAGARGGYTGGSGSVTGGVTGGSGVSSPMAAAGAMAGPAAAAGGMAAGGAGSGGSPMARGPAYAAGPAGSGGAPVAAEEFAVLGDVRAWYRALLTKDKGILYEDTYLQIGLQSRCERAQGHVTLFLGNKLVSAPLEQLAVTTVAPPQLAMSFAPPPPALAPKQQLQIPISVTCLGHVPSNKPPLLRLSYTVGGRQVAQELQLPITSSKFMVPEPGIAKEAFFTLWKSFSGPPNKAQEMVERAPGSAPLSIDATLALLRGLGFGVEHQYLDPSPHNEAGAAQFWFGQPGAEQSALAQCRVEGNPQNRLQFRVTTAAPHPGLAAALKDAIADLIRATP